MDLDFDILTLKVVFNEKKVLITDIVFPNKYATWRNTEILAFIKEYDTDIFVYKVNVYQGLKFDWDFGLEIYDGLLDGYQLLSFGDGRFLVTRDKSGVFDLSKYDLVHHIFLQMYVNFNSNFGFPQEKQSIHLYPGGGYEKIEDVAKIDRKVKIIATQPYADRDLQEIGFENYINVWGAPMFHKGEDFVVKTFQEKKLNICFASLGSGKSKGEFHYINVCNEYKKIYPDDNVQFLSIGRSALFERNKYIITHPPRDYVALAKFYRENVDIYMNLETGMGLRNGWPLGLEAIAMGCLLLTRDPHKVSKYYSVPENSVPFRST